jgi:regulator of nonsense transcripts 2
MTLVNMDKESKAFNNIAIVLSFCKHCGRDYAGLVPKRVKTLSARFGAAAPVSTFLPAEKQKNVRALLADYYAALSKYLVESQKELNAFEKQSRKMLLTRGEIPKDRVDKGESMKAAQAKTLANVQQFADVLDEQVPALPPPGEF